MGLAYNEGTVRLRRAAAANGCRAAHERGLAHTFTAEEQQRGSRAGGRARWQGRPGGHLAMPKPRPSSRKPGETRGRPADEARRAEAVRLRVKGLTLAEIGRRMGVSRQAVQLMLSRAIGAAGTGGK